MLNRALLVPLAALLLLPAFGCGGGGRTEPQRLVVTNLLDAGNGSLRNRIAISSPGAEITFAAGLNGEIPLATGLTVDKSLSIIGPGADVITVHGGDLVRPFDVLAGTTVAISGLRVWKGAGGNGAGIRNQGDLTLTRVVVSACTATGTNRGGGIQSRNGVLRATDCEINQCFAFNGAGFANEIGTMTLRRCTITKCQTTGNSGGGGINSEGTLIVVNCTFSENSTTGADRIGGGLVGGAEFVDSQTTILNCTFTNNAATGMGGGIYISNDSPTGPYARIDIRNSIVAGNVAPAGPDLDFVDGTVTMATNNFVGDGENSTLTHGADGNVVGSNAAPLNPNLALLGDNGGPTPTHLPNAGSPVRDMVPIASCVNEVGAPLTVDQRSSPRPVGADADAGSVESPEAPAP